MKPTGTLLIVDDNKNILTSLRFILAEYFERIITLSTPVSLISVIQKENIDVVLLDMNFSAGINSGNEGLYWLTEIHKINSEISVVLFTAYADIGLAVNGMKNGAFDFIVKPWDNTKLIDTLRKALSLKKRVTKRNNTNNAKTMYWGSHKTMLDVKSIVERVAPTDANILITGENGTGKDMLADEIHRLSRRGTSAMIKVDVGSISESLFESEMFGHVKGAFTDAGNDRMGRMEAANRGTLFLDEIANIPIVQQAKLLTALQQRSIIRVGANVATDIDIRLVCATNKNIRELISDGLFREDLMYRINTIHIELPALREHKSDIIPLANIFIDRYVGIYNRNNIDGLDEDAANALYNYNWPGNIRELQHTIEKAIILSEGGLITKKALCLPQQSVAEITDNTETLEELGRKLIVNALEKYGNNLSLVAVKLGISRQTLYNKMKRYGL